MPRFSSRELARLSRDRSFLIRLAIWITTGSIVLALLFSLIFQEDQTELKAGTNIEDLMEQWSEIQRNSEPESMEDWLEVLRFDQLIAGENFAPDSTWIDYPRDLETTDFSEVEITEGDSSEEMIEALEIFQEALGSGALVPALAKMERLPEDLPYRNEILGDLLFLSEKYAEASLAYQREVENRAGEKIDYAARSAVTAARRAVDRDTLSNLLRQAPYRKQFGAGEQLRIFTDARDYLGMAISTLHFELVSFLKLGTLPSIGIAAIWFLILMPFWEVSRTRIVAALFAFGLGVFSASLTLFFVLVQERIQGFDFDAGVAPFAQFLYFAAGVGLREETLKLVCFLPAAIWAVKRKSDIEGMMLAAMVGLGFAFKENILYLDSGLTTYLGWVRFLTANVLHFSLTGVAGFYLYRMLRRKGHGWEEFLASFIIVVLAHGTYNSVLAMPSLASYAPLSPILIAIIAYRFFDPLRSTMDTVGIGHRVSPLGVFVLGSVLLTCLVLLTSSLDTPYRFALGAFLASVGGMVPLSFAFISRFRDL